MALPEYIPILKSSDAELRGFSHLTDQVKDNILPLFELTRSRSSRNLPEGDIFRRVEQIKSNVENRPFILDLTTYDNLINSQIEALLGPEGGFENWCNFLESLELPNLIPMIHGLDDDPRDDMGQQVRRLDENFDYLAFRADMFDPDTPVYASKIFENISSPEKLILIVDAAFIRQAHATAFAATATRRIAEVTSIEMPGMIFVCGSSFPKSVTDYGDDLHDSFPMEEVEFYKLVAAEFPDYPIHYSDYATVHPVRYDVRGGNWVPRVDIILDDRIIYYRARRDQGGYTAAAASAIRDPEYDDIGSWGDYEIRAAAAGNPNGRSPAYWISVRINTHITRKALNGL